MGSFAELKSIGTKVIKYKQGKSLSSDEVLFEVGLSKTKFDEAQQGVCAALTLFYIQDILNSQLISGPLINFPKDEQTRFKRNQGMSSSISIGDKQIAASAIKLQSAVTGGDHGEKIQQFAKNNAIASQWGSGMSFGDKFLNDFDKTFIANQNKTVFYVWYQFNFVNSSPQKSGAHAVAVWRDDDDVHFFDPNIGGYRVAKNNWGKFNAKYVDLLREKIGWKITSAKSLPFSK
jgi:hypothetical protein